MTKGQPNEFSLRENSRLSVLKVLQHAFVGLSEVCCNFVESSILIMKILLSAHTAAVYSAL